MRAASLPHAAYRTQVSWRSRAISALLAFGVVALLILVLIRMGAFPGRLSPEMPALSTFDVSSAGPKAGTQTQQQTRERKAEKLREPPRTAPPPPQAPPPPIVLPGVMNLSRADFASSNIGNLPRSAAPGTGQAMAQAEAGGGGDDDGAGAGPGGEKLYNAEWYRRPTRAEMSTYLPVGRPGWGMIACRTAERFRVEDCRELSETPGSGIARGLRRASWQFLVRPPRVGGKPMIGAWVRIKFDLIEDATD